jgi:DNA repair protein RAD51
MLDFIKSRNLDPNILDRVKVARITNTSEQINYLSKIKEDSFTLVVIDNITDLFSYEFSKDVQNLEKNIIFMQYMHDLSLISIQKKIPIIVTNMIRKFDDFESENLDKSISMFTHVKIQLFKKGTKYFGKIIPSLNQKKEFEYQITKEGLIDEI